MKINIEESRSGIMNKFELNEGGKELVLASYDKSDLQELMKYSGNFDIPSGRFSSYLLTNFLDQATDDCGLDPETLEKIIFPTGSSSDTKGSLETFGMLKILSNKYLAIIKVPPMIDSVIAKNDSGTLFTVLFETQDEILQTKLLFLVIDTFNDSQPINVSAQVFSVSKTAYRNKPRQVLRVDTLNQLIQESPKVGVELTDNLLVGRETGVILGQKKIDPDSCQIFKSFSERNQGTWDITTIYSEGDQVLYHGVTWKSLISGNLGVRPPGYTWEAIGSYEKSAIREVTINPSENFELSISGKVAYFSGRDVVLQITPIKAGVKFSSLTDQDGNEIELKSSEGNYVTFIIPPGVTEININQELAQCEVFVYYQVDNTTYRYPEYTGLDLEILFPDGAIGNSYTYNSTDTPEITFNYPETRFEFDRISHGIQLSESITPSGNSFVIQDPRSLDFYCIFLKSKTYQVVISGENLVCDFTPRSPKEVNHGDTIVYRVYSESSEYYQVTGDATVSSEEIQENEYNLTISNIRSNIQISIS